jgi:hypothetical protein
MDNQDKIAEQAAEIARLTKTIAWYQGRAGQRIGEAARAGIAGPVRGMAIAQAVRQECLNNYSPDAHYWSEAMADIDLAGVIRSVAAPASMPQLAAPNGYKLVPIEPTHLMVGAGARAMLYAEKTEQASALKCMPIAYRAMIAAAPDATPLPELTGPSAFLADLKAIDRAMQHMGDTLNEMDVLDADDEDIAAPGFAALAKLLSAAASPSPAPAQQQEPRRIEITINGRQLRDALEAAWTERSDPDEGDTELTLFVRDKAEVSVEGEAMEPGLWFYWTDYPEEGVCYLDPNAPETASVSESADTAAPGASIGDVQ